MLVAGVFFAGMGVFVKLGSQHFSSSELVFYRSVFAVVVVLAAVRAKRLSPTTRHWKFHVARSLAGFAGMMLLFYVIGVLPLATATTLNYTSPLFLVVLTALVFRQRLQAGLVVAVVLGFIGVAVLLRPTINADQAVAGLLGLASGLCAGVAYLTTRQLGQLGEPAWRVVFYFALVSTVGSGAFALVGGFHAFGLDQVLILLGLGFSATMGQLAMTHAYAVGEPLTVGSLGYSTVVFTTLAAIAVWGEQVPLANWLAMGLIIGSGVLSVRISATPASALVGGD